MWPTVMKRSTSPANSACCEQRLRRRKAWGVPGSGQESALLERRIGIVQPADSAELEPEVADLGEEALKRRLILKVSGQQGLVRGIEGRRRHARAFEQRFQGATESSPYDDFVSRTFHLVGLRASGSRRTWSLSR